MLNLPTSDTPPANEFDSLSNSLYAYKESSEAGTEGQKIHIQGDPGTGKTLYAGQAASEFKLLWLDFESGRDSLISNLTDDQLKNITYVKIPDTQTSPTGIITAVSMFEKKKGFICRAHGVWGCAVCGSNPAKSIPIDLNDWTPEKKGVIVLDSATQLSWSAYFQGLKQLKKDITNAEDKTTFDLWRIQGAYLSKLFMDIQANPYHVISTSHEHEIDMENKTKRLVPSIGTTTVKKEFTKYFGHKLRTVVDPMGNYKVFSTPKAGSNAALGSRWNVDATQAGVTILDFLRKPESTPAITKPASTGLGATPSNPNPFAKG